MENTVWPEEQRFENPHKYYVDLSQKLWEIKNNLLRHNVMKLGLDIFGYLLEQK